MDDARFDIEHFIAMPRVSGLAISHDGTRLVTQMAELDDDKRVKYLTSLWEVDPTGEAEPRRLTQPAQGDSLGAFLPDGSLLFTSSRPVPGTESKGDDEPTRLWLLPPTGEARVVADPPAGVDGVEASRDGSLVVTMVGRYPGTKSGEDDKARQEARDDLKVGAQLFETYPIRYWDHYLGPRQPHLLAASPTGPDGRLENEADLTPDVGDALAQGEDVNCAVSDDGKTVVAAWQQPFPPAMRPLQVVAIDVASGEHRILAAEDDATYGTLALSPDGTQVVAGRETFGRLEAAFQYSLWLIDVATGERRDLLPDFEHWPGEPIWMPDGSAVVFVADEAADTPVFRVEVGGPEAGKVTRLTASGVYDSLRVAPDGSAIYAMRSTMNEPPHVVALDPAATEQDARVLPTPGWPLSLEPPGKLESITATADDGTEIQSWLVLPPGASADSPAPLAVFIHGGPYMAWSFWSWRWQPHLLIDQGYAVLLPNPALSTGFGQDYINRGWGHWGEAPFLDIMRAVDSACERPDIDETRTAALGGSFGGFMSNWIAGHTDRFRCIVTHASLWSLTQFHGTTDLGPWWEHEMGDPYVDLTRYEANSPDRHVGSIRTPMLVVHGERDHRVPIAEGLKLWTDLCRHGVDAKLLYFPDENHWILKPQNVKVWYDTVLAFLAHHVLGEEWHRPDIL
jgi:dipeptidyl aminopeptidase/acylaminoacyl peptidase